MSYVIIHPVATTRRNAFIHTTNLTSLAWTYVTNNDVKTTEALRRRFHFDPIDLRDMRPPLQRPKLVVRDGYLFMILLYPAYHKKSGQVETIEIDFFIQKDLLVTVNAGGNKKLEQLFTSASEEKHSDIGHLLYRILDTLLEQTFPMVVDLSDQIDSIEKRMFRDFEKNLIQELLRVKMNIVAVRKAIQGHKMVIRQLIQASEGRFPIHRLEAYFNRLVEHTKELWDTLEIQHETINALHETNASLIDFRINEIMKTLTIFSVIVFPLTLLAAIFGMNAVNMPIVEHPYGFWIIIVLMAVGTFGMLLIFKRKRWI